MRYLRFGFVTCLLASGVALAQATPPGEKKPESSPAAVSGDSNATTAESANGKAAAYYHYSLGHLYAEMAGAFGNRGEYFTKAVDNFRQAMKDDPGATFIAEELSDLYIQSGRLRDAVMEAEELLKQNPNDVNDRRILARIYSRLIGEPQQSRIDETMLKKAIEQYQKITELEPKDIDSWILLGRLQKIAQNTPEAQKAFKAALAIDPDNDDAMTGLARVYMDVGDSKAAADLLKKVAERNPTARSLETLAEFYEQTKDYRQAADTLKKAIDLNPDNADLKRNLAEDLLFSDQDDAALKLYQDLVGSDPHDAKSQLRIAQIYRQQHNFPRAEQAEAKAKEMAPDDLEVAFDGVILLEAEGKLPEAIKALNDMLSSTERSGYSGPEKQNRARMLDTLGNLYRTNEQYIEAANAYKEEGDLDDEEFGSRAAAEIVETWRTAKDYQKAREAADAALKKYPNDSIVQSVHASLMADMGRYDQAIAETKKMLGGKDDQSVWKSLAQIYEKQKNFTEMGKAIDEADKLSVSKDDHADIEFLRGAMLERQKQYDAAEAKFRKVLELEPNNASAMNYLGYMLADNNVRLDEAEKLINKALEQDPNNGAYMDSLGWVYFRMKKYPQAEEQLRRALQKLSRDATVHDHLGDVYLGEGRVREAMTQWESSVKDYQDGAPSDLDQEELAKVQKKLEGAKVRLAREGHGPRE